MPNHTELIIQATEQPLEELVHMGLDLWPDNDYQSLKDTFIELLQAPDKYNILLFSQDGKYIAFLYLSIRTDYVEGSDSSPTGYIEGIYVKSEFRKMGISQKLLLEGEKWLKEKGCRQIGSDIHIDNQVSYDFHTRVGFKESARLIALIKDIT